MFNIIFANKAILVSIIIAIAVIVICCLGYIKAPPDVAYIVSGLRKKPKILIGRAGIRVPFLERVDKAWRDDDALQTFFYLERAKTVDLYRVAIFKMKFHLAD